MESFRYIVTEPSLVGAADVSVTTLGYRMCREGVTDQPRPSGHFTLLHFYDACFLRDDAGDVRLFPPGMAVVFGPDSAQYFGDSRRSWRHSWMHFQGEHADTLLEDNRIPLGRPFANPRPEVVEMFLLGFHREVTEHTVPDRVIVRNLFVNLVRELRRLVHGESDSDQGIPKRLLLVRNYMESHYNQPMPLAGLAARASYSEAHFGVLFRRHFGVSPIEFLITLRLGEAVRLLGDANLTVGQVARMVGYSDIHYFSRLFKRRLGVGPRAYRNGEREAECT